jgi:hypothetical protein
MSNSRVFRLLAEGTSTKVALRRRSGGKESLAHVVATSIVFMIKAKAERVFPIPISSVINPPPDSLPFELDFS